MTDAADAPRLADHEPRERDLCRALLTRHHLGVPERRSLPGGRARFSVLTTIIADALRTQGWFPGRTDLDAQRPLAVLESRGGHIWLHERFEASAYGRVTSLRSRTLGDAAEATRAYILSRGDRDGSSIDGVPVDWES